MSAERPGGIINNVANRLTDALDRQASGTETRYPNSGVPVLDVIGVIARSYGRTYFYTFPIRLAQGAAYLAAEMSGGRKYSSPAR